MNEPKFYQGDRLAFSLAEVATVLAVSLRTVWYHAQRDGLPVRVLSLRYRRVTRADLLEWCRSRPPYTAAVPLLARPDGLVGGAFAKLDEAPRLLGNPLPPGFPVVRGGAGSRPRLAVAEVAAWLQGQPRYQPRQGGRGVVDRDAERLARAKAVIDTLMTGPVGPEAKVASQPPQQVTGTGAAA